MLPMLLVAVCDSSGWGGWHCFSSSNFKGTAGPISVFLTTELTVIEAMVLVLGQDPGHQLLLQRRALQGTQPCSLSGDLVSCQTNAKEMLLLGQHGNKHHTHRVTTHKYPWGSILTGARYPLHGLHTQT